MSARGAWQGPGQGEHGPDCQVHRAGTLLREVAAREGVSQNELVEQAIEHELVLRGELLAKNLAAAADRLAKLSQREMAAVTETAAAAFATSEAGADPVQARRFVPPAVAEDRPDQVGAVAAFLDAR